MMNDYELLLNHLRNAKMSGQEAWDYEAYESVDDTFVIQIIEGCEMTEHVYDANGNYIESLEYDWRGNYEKSCKKPLTKERGYAIM